MRHVLVSAVAVAVLLLTACVQEPPAAEPSESAPAPSPSSTSDATPPAQTSTPEPTVYPGVDVACDSLISAQVMYDYNSNYNLIGEIAPDAGSLAASVTERNGKTCRWINASSNLTIDLAVARIPEPALTTLQNETLESSNPVPTYGVEGYFALDGAIGQAQAFAGEYWLVLESPYFAEPGDAAPLMKAVVESL